MENIKTVLYIHGYKSSGHTGNFLEKFLKQFDIEVLHPQIPEDYNLAHDFIKDILKRNKIDLIIASSLGGYMALDAECICPKIVINPCIKPYEKLPELNCPNEIVNSYPILRTPMATEKESTFGIFGGKDEILDYKDEFSMRYDHNKMFFVPEGKHSLTDDQLTNVLPMILEKADNAAKEIMEFWIKFSFDLGKQLGYIF